MLINNVQNRVCGESATLQPEAEELVALHVLIFHQMLRGITSLLFSSIPFPNYVLRKTASSKAEELCKIF